VQREPWIERDRAMIDALRTIGIEKGKPFKPDAKTQEILKSAILEARDRLAARYDAGFVPFFQNTKNEHNAYSLNSITAKKNEDGSVMVQFGGCDGKTPNCLPTLPGWNYMVRLYCPWNEILDGTWKFPEAQPVK
jgi:hypothetical protein